MDKFERLIQLDKERSECRQYVNAMLKRHSTGTNDMVPKLMNDENFKAATDRLAVLESEYLRAISELSLNEIMAMGDKYGT